MEQLSHYGDERLHRHLSLGKELLVVRFDSWLMLRGHHGREEERCAQVSVPDFSDPDLAAD
jgi:hypothetical protein